MRKTSVFLLVLLMLNVNAKADVFSLPTNENILYQSGQPFNEYLIYTADKKCFLHYLSPTAPASDWTFRITQQSEIEGADCLEKGFASVDIKDGKNNLIQTLNGYFLDGFFIGATPLNSYAIKRSAQENGIQELFYFIDKDETLGIQYIGKMSAYPINEVYTSFEVCSSFEAILQTNNKDLFKDEETVKNLFTVTKSYAQTLCPQTDMIILKATDSPSLNENGVFFQKLFKKDLNSNLWSSEEIPLLKEMTQPVKQTAPQENPTPKSDKLVVHISDKSSDKVLFIDKPYLMKAYRNEQTANLKSDWYEVSATLTPMDDLEKKRSGISLNEKAAIIEITAARRCYNSECR